jgi:hypothetical protein
MQARVGVNDAVALEDMMFLPGELFGLLLHTISSLR